MPVLVPEATAIRILLVDDDALSRRTLGQLLKIEGFACAHAANGAEALELVETFHPQVILMDLMMPVLDGFETARHLKADMRTCSIPLLALTGSTTAADRRHAELAGFNDFLAKPVELNQLLPCLQYHLAYEQKIPGRDSRFGTARRER